MRDLILFSPSKTFRRNHKIINVAESIANYIIIVRDKKNDGNWNKTQPRGKTARHCRETVNPLPTVVRLVMVRLRTLKMFDIFSLSDF